MLQNNSSNLCYKSLGLAAAQFDTQNKLSLEGSSKKNIQKFLWEGGFLDVCMSVCMYVCMCPELKATNGGMGRHVWQEKGAKKQKEAHYSIIMTTFYFFYFYLFKFFWGKNLSICTHPTHYIYTTVVNFPKKIKCDIYFEKFEPQKRKKKKREREGVP